MGAFFENAQWRVTAEGIESKNVTPTYFLTLPQLRETIDRGAGLMYDVPVHMAEKIWVDIDAFIEAFQKGLELYAARNDFEPNYQMLEASFKKARNNAADEETLKAGFAFGPLLN